MNSCTTSLRSLLPAAARLLQPPRLHVRHRPEVVDVVRGRFLCQPSASMVATVSRGYCTFIRRPITHSVPRGYIHDPLKVTAAPTALTFHGGKWITINRGFHVETVPYTNRNHLVTFSARVARKISERQFADLKIKHASKIVDPQNNDSARVNEIGSKVIGSIHSVLSTKSKMAQAGPEEPSQKITRLDWVDEFNWEMIVIQDEDIAGVTSYAGGKIVVSTGFLERFSRDAEIAVVIAHEVGHVIARHSVEMIKLFVAYECFPTSLLATPFLRRNEMEADYIGMLLLAAAGFDPRTAPQFFDKLGKIKGESTLSNLFAYFSLTVHPSCKKRSWLLSRPKVMEEAMEIYRDVIRAQGVA